MQLPAPLIPGRLIQRYKRFLADIQLDTGETITAACPNTGSMLGLTAPGSRVWVSETDSATRKYRHTWEMVEADGGLGPTLVGINTNRPNAIVMNAIETGGLGDLAGYANARREVKYGLNSRIDILLDGGKDERRCYVEIKNVHLVRKAGLAEFPDSKTERGAKHLDELSGMVRAGNRAVMIYLVQRNDASETAIAADIDRAYGDAFRRAQAAGVEMLSYRCALSPAGIAIDQQIPVRALA
jgi:sugar fermentation stimulation protein A